MLPKLEEKLGRVKCKDRKTGGFLGAQGEVKK
jgi:hypothetical protein